MPIPAILILSLEEKFLLYAIICSSIFLREAKLDSDPADKSTAVPPRFWRNFLLEV
jgi:hypothetical protein